MEKLYKIASVFFFLVVDVFKALSVHRELFIGFPWLICTIQECAELDGIHSWEFPGAEELQEPAVRAAWVAFCFIDYFSCFIDLCY